MSHRQRRTNPLSQTELIATKPYYNIITGFADVLIITQTNKLCHRIWCLAGNHIIPTGLLRSA